MRVMKESGGDSHSLRTPPLIFLFKTVSLLLQIRGPVSNQRTTVTGTQPMTPDFARLLQLRILRFRLFQDRNVGIGVFPEREEIFVGGKGPDAGGVGIRSLRSLGLLPVHASDTEMCQRSRPAVPDEAAMACCHH